MLGPRGAAVIVGLPPITNSMPILPTELIFGEKTLTGALMGSTRLSVDIPRLVALYQAGRIKLDEMITGRYPLEKINEAQELVERGEALRNVIVF